MPDSLLSPILTDGLRRIHYFNGRVLTAEDLAVEQGALRQRDRRLGRSLGTGVVEGLEVAAAGGAAVTIAAGLALNREGEVLALAKPVTVAVVPETAAVAPGDALFVPCPGAATGTAIPAGTGAYVLVVGPAAGPEGLAPHVGLADDGVARTCATRFVVDGVQFRLLHLDVESDALVPDALADPIRDLAALAAPTTAERSRLRNLLAHWCLGTAEAAAFAADLLGPLGGDAPEPTYGPLDALRALDPADPDRLAECEVPLALLFWSQDAIAFLDGWAVRRRVHRRPAAASPPFPALDRRAAEAHAASLQFQRHVAELTGPGASQALLAQVRVGDYFRFLPPVGALPERVWAARGFTHLEFFEGRAFREPVFIEGARVTPLFDLAAAYPAVDLEEDELIWLYRVRQNRQPGATTPPAYLLFTGGHVPYQGDAHYDVARWNYSNYGLGVAGSIAIAL